MSLNPSAKVKNRRTPLLTCASVLIGLCGCGRATEASVARTALAPYRAIALHDATAFCDDFTASVRQRIAKSVTHAGSCASAVRSVFRKAQNLSAWRDVSKSIQVRGIRVSRRDVDIATVTYAEGGVPVAVTMERTHGTWRIATNQLSPIYVDVAGCEKRPLTVSRSRGYGFLSVIIRRIRLACEWDA